MESDICVLCNEPLVNKLPVVTLREKGSEGINQASVKCKDNIMVVPGQKVHSDCLRLYCNPNKILQAQKLGTSPAKVNRKFQLRSGEECFNFSSDCFCCSNAVNIEDQGKGVQEMFSCDNR